MGTDDREAVATLPPERPRCGCHGEPTLFNGRCAVKHRERQARYFRTPKGHATDRRYNDKRTRARRDERNRQRRAELDAYYRGG